MIVSIGSESILDMIDIYVFYTCVQKFFPFDIKNSVQDNWIRSNLFLFYEFVTRDLYIILNVGYAKNSIDSKKFVNANFEILDLRAHEHIVNNNSSQR